MNKSQLEVHRLRSRLDSTFGRAPSSNADPQLQSDFAKYLCVLVSGFFENAIVAMILDYVETRSAPQVSRFVERELDRWTNPNVDKLVTLMGSFDPGWREALGTYLEDERKDSVNGLVALRHQIAHGEHVGVTLATIKRYYAVVDDVLKFISRLLFPHA